MLRQVYSTQTVESVSVSKKVEVYCGIQNYFEAAHLAHNLASVYRYIFPELGS